MDEQEFVDSIENLIKYLKEIKQISDIHLPLEITELQSKNHIFPLSTYVEVKPSTIHGNGIFARTNIEKGKVVSLYPCHGIFVSSSGYFLEKYKDIAYSDPIIQKYKVKLSRQDDSEVFAIPYIKDNGLLGHLINDSYRSISDFKDINKDITYFGKTITKYMLNSIACDNCRLIVTPNYIYLKTIRDINEGEELVNSYSYPYWCAEESNIPMNEINTLIESYVLSLSNEEKMMFTNIYNTFINLSTPATSNSVEKIEI
jgi:SET domain-containing protein